jgi:CHAT domain-containing protein
MIRVLFIGLVVITKAHVMGVYAQSHSSSLLEWVEHHQAFKTSTVSQPITHYYDSLSLTLRDPLYAYLALINEPDSLKRTRDYERYSNEHFFGKKSPEEKARIHSVLRCLGYPKQNASLLDSLPSHLIPVISYELIINRRLDAYVDETQSNDFFNDLRAHYNQLSNFTEISSSNTLLSTTKNSFNQEQLKRDLLLYSILWHDYNATNYASLLQWHQRHGPLDMLPNTIDKAKLLMAIAYTQFSAGLYSEVLTLLEFELLALSEVLEHEDLRFETNNLHGVSLNQIGKYADAEHLFKQLLNHQLSNEERSQLLNNLGLSLLYQGKQLEYQNVMNQAYALAEETKNARDMLIISQNLFLQNIQYGNILGAEDYLVQAEHVAQVLGTQADRANIAYLKAIKLWDYQKNKIEAVRLLEEAIALLDLEKDFLDWTRLSLKLADILMETHEYLASEKVLNGLRKVALARKDVQLLFDANVFLGELFFIQNKPSNVPIILQELDEFKTKNLRFSTFVRYESLKNEWAFHQGFEDLAVQKMQELVQEIIARIQLSNHRESGFWLQVKAYSRAFSVLNTCYLKQEDVEQSLILMDQIKNLNQVVLGASQMSLLEQLNEQEAARERYLREITQRLRGQYVQEDDANERNLILSRLDQFESERNQLMRSRNLAPPIQTLSPRDLQLIQQNLTPKTLLLHINELYGDLIIFALDRKKLRVKKVPLRYEQNLDIQAALSNVQQGSSKLLELFELFELLQLPQWLTKDYEDLLVIQDPLLFGLPLDILPVEKPESDYSYGSASYVIEHWKVQLYPSLRSYVRLSNHQRPLFANKRLNFVGFGKSNFNDVHGDVLSSSLSYLRNAPIEILEASYKLRTRLTTFEYINEDASKNTFRDEVHKADILHIASHSIVNEGNPLFSKIILSSSDHSLEALYAYELFNLDLNPRITILNACSSGSGNSMQGSGLLGFSRALLYSGTQGMMLNLWAVTDETARQVSNQFYDGLLNRESTVDAIRQAKLNVLENANADPHHWGGYQYIGAPVYLTETPSAPFYVSSLILLGLFWGICSRRKEAYSDALRE